MHAYIYINIYTHRVSEIVDQILKASSHCTDEKSFINMGSETFPFQVIFLFYIVYNSPVATVEVLRNIIASKNTKYFENF